jgi:hypothetical protein
MYERRSVPPVSRAVFALRLAQHLGFALLVIAVSLLAGMIGYAHFEGLSWLDAFLNASMLLGGMGPVETPRTAGGKLFAGMYALYAGMVFLIVAGVLLAPVVHRVMHRFHWEQEDRESE